MPTVVVPGKTDQAVFHAFEQSRGAELVKQCVCALLLAFLCADRCVCGGVVCCDLLLVLSCFALFYDVLYYNALYVILSNDSVLPHNT